MRPHSRSAGRNRNCADCSVTSTEKKGKRNILRKGVTSVLRGAIALAVESRGSGLAAPKLVSQNVREYAKKKIVEIRMTKI